MGVPVAAPITASSSPTPAAANNIVQLRRVRYRHATGTIRMRVAAIRSRGGACITTQMPSGDFAHILCTYRAYACHARQVTSCGWLSLSQSSRRAGEGDCAGLWRGRHGPLGWAGTARVPCSIRYLRGHYSTIMEPLHLHDLLITNRLNRSRCWKVSQTLDRIFRPVFGFWVYRGI